MSGGQTICDVMSKKWLNPFIQILNSTSMMYISMLWKAVVVLDYIYFKTLVTGDSAD